MATTDEKKFEWTYDLFVKIGFPIIMAICVYFNNEIGKLRDNQSTLATKEDLRMVRNDVVDRITYQVSAINEKLAIVIDRAERKEK